MNKNQSMSALKLSLAPAVLASSCCLTLPALALLGISFAENIFIEHVIALRGLAVALLIVSLLLYFYKQGVRTKDDFITHKAMVFYITLQTFVFALGFYVIFLTLVVPLLCALTGVGSCYL